MDFDTNMTMPTYIIYREVSTEAQLDSISPLSFYPPKDSDELFDALRSKYPHLRSHSERMRDAIIDFLLEERATEAMTASFDTIADQTYSPWQQSVNSWPSSSAVESSPQLTEISTPVYGSNIQQPSSNEASPPEFDEMTSVFSLTSNEQPKQRLRRKMTEAEKVEYRKRRVMKACEKCAKRKRKCTHNQASSSSITAPKKTQRKASKSTLYDHHISSVTHTSTDPSLRIHAPAQSETDAGNVHYDDFTLLIDQTMLDLDFDDIWQPEDVNSFRYVDPMPTRASATNNQQMHRRMLPSRPSEGSNSSHILKPVSSTDTSFGIKDSLQQSMVFHDSFQQQDGHGLGVRNVRPTSGVIFDTTASCNEEHSMLQPLPSLDLAPRSTEPIRTVLSHKNYRGESIVNRHDAYCGLESGAMSFGFRLQSPLGDMKTGQLQTSQPQEAVQLHQPVGELAPTVSQPTKVSSRKQALGLQDAKQKERSCFKSTVYDQATKVYHNSPTTDEMQLRDNEYSIDTSVGYTCTNDTSNGISKRSESLQGELFRLRRRIPTSTSSRRLRALTTPLQVNTAVLESFDQNMPNRHVLPVDNTNTKPGRLALSDHTTPTDNSQDDNEHDVHDSFQHDSTPQQTLLLLSHAKKAREEQYSGRRSDHFWVRDHHGRGFTSLQVYIMAASLGLLFLGFVLQLSTGSCLALACCCAFWSTRMDGQDHELATSGLAKWLAKQRSFAHVLCLGLLRDV